MPEMGERMRWLRENVSFFNTVLIVISFFVLAGRSFGVNETKVANIETKIDDIMVKQVEAKAQATTDLKEVKEKQQTTIDQGTQNGIALGLIQRDVKGLTDDVANERARNEAQERMLNDHERRIGVMENRTRR